MKDVLSQASVFEPDVALEIDGTLYFIGSDGEHGFELWKSDGTEAGTMMVKDINPQGDSLYHYAAGRSLANVGGVLFFIANDGTNGLELWKSDGTESGTELVRDISPGISSGAVDLFDSFEAIDGIYYFGADDGVHGVEMWRSDGTLEGTQLLLDIQPGPANGLVENEDFVFIAPSSANVQGTLYFSANDGVHGAELWRSDGTAEGTQLVADVVPGPGWSNPNDLIAINQTLFFTGRADGFRELFVMELPQPGDFNTDDQLDASDIDALSAAIRRGRYASRFDLTNDRSIDSSDRAFLVEQAIQTWFGDSNLDGRFDTEDLIAVFQQGEYMDGVVGNSTWSAGDWNGDGDFTTDDLMFAFQSGGYRKGNRPVVV